MRNQTVLALYFTFVCAPVAIAQGVLKTGMPAPSAIVGDFVTGHWAEKGRASPIHLNHDSPKIAVFAKTFDDRMLPMVTEIDEIVARTPSLKWSFLFLSHENSPTPTDDEWEAQRASLKTLATNNMIKQLSFGIMLRLPDTGRPVSAKRQLGFLNDGDVVLMLVVPNPANKLGTIRHVEIIKTDKLEQNSIERIIRDLRLAIAQAGIQG